MIVIPEMTHKLGRYWDQPDKNEFVIDQLSPYAIMEEVIFKKFKNYSHSIPTGAYEGKMWVCTRYIKGKETNYLKWYDTVAYDYTKDNSPLQEGEYFINVLEIIII